MTALCTWPKHAASAGAAEEVATAPETAPAYMAQAVLGFNEQLERICEVAVVVLIGGMLTAQYLPGEALWFVPLLFLVIRPIAVLLGLSRSHVTGTQRRLICWFGIRGVGSLYYLAYAMNHARIPDIDVMWAVVALVTATPMNAKAVIVVGRPSAWPRACERWLRA